MKLTVAAIFFSMVLGGCATTPTPIHEGKTVPANRVFFSSNPDDNSATAVFVRDSGFLGSGGYIHLYIDGKKAATFDPGESVSLNLPAGEHIIGVIPTDIGIGAVSMYSIDQNLAVRSQYFYRILIETNGVVRIQRVSGFGMH